MWPSAPHSCRVEIWSVVIYMWAKWKISEIVGYFCCLAKIRIRKAKKKKNISRNGCFLLPIRNEKCFMQSLPLQFITHFSTIATTRTLIMSSFSIVDNVGPFAFRSKSHSTLTDLFTFSLVIEIKINFKNSCKNCIQESIHNAKLFIASSLRAFVLYVQTCEWFFFRHFLVLGEVTWSDA